VASETFHVVVVVVVVAGGQISGYAWPGYA
jgi:hypothetical protein